MCEQWSGIYNHTLGLNTSTHAPLILILSDHSSPPSPLIPSLPYPSLPYSSTPSPPILYSNPSSLVPLSHAHLPSYNCIPPFNSFPDSPRYLINIILSNNNILTSTVFYSKKDIVYSSLFLLNKSFIVTCIEKLQ